MPQWLQKYATITSSSYSDNISIPLSLQSGCKTLSLRNRSTSIPVSITVSGITTDIRPNETLVDHYERNWFNEIDIETELGHDFILELYRD